MDIELKQKGEALSIVIDGNIDTDGGHKLGVALQEAMEMDGIKSITFDLSTVRTITSSGIGKLMNFFKFIDSKKGTMAVKGISDSLYKQFMEIHLDRIFPIGK
ncbi:MAG TPA: STAS domain-containing protein [Rectinemataceae bacterium]|nr:STAS domain-containing protein [Rectinemataceae bacterium]